MVNINVCKIRFYVLLFFIFLSLYPANSQTNGVFVVDLNWSGIEKFDFYGKTCSRISFNNAIYEGDIDDVRPYYRHIIPVYSDEVVADFNLNVSSFELVPADELRLLPNDIDTLPYYKHVLLVSRDNTNICFDLFPFFKNDDGIMRITSCDVSYVLTPKEKRNVRLYAENSVLSSGKWYKMSLSSSGMYKLTYSQLSEMGFPVSSVNPKNIRLYHNGGGVLPLVVGDERHDDLVEIPIYVHGENDGLFNENDYVVFYARGPVTWANNDGFYERLSNPYSDYSCVFLTADLGEGKRIQYAAYVDGNADVTVTSFLDYQLKEENMYNLNNMGATWYFDKFDAVNTMSYDFNFPNIIAERKCFLKSEMASRNTSGSASFRVKSNGTLISNVNFSAISDNSTYARIGNTGKVDFVSSKDEITISLDYVKTGTSSIAWLDYIVVNAWRELRMTGNMMSFRNPECFVDDNVYRYEIRNASSNMQVWDVTNPVEPVRMRIDIESNVASFNVEGKKDSEFIAFNGNDFKSPTFISTVQNQNLHSKYDFDYLIIAHPNFYSHAERLKEIHSRIDDLEIEITTPQQIYNEFSCGALDITAIRDYIKMVYAKSDKRLRYVLLFGDASYDFRNKSGQVCFVPSYEYVRSCSSSSFVTDDYYVCMDAHEGAVEQDGSVVDIALGRMPVTTVEEADAILDKIEMYVSNDEEGMGTWRKLVTFAADDNILEYMRHAEQLEGIIKDNAGEDVNIDKIYLDAYPQVATSSGQRSPEFNAAINNRVEMGSLIIHYVGHAGEVGWADERILTNEDIISWRNSPKLHLMITASCEFTRFDDHTRTSAGEHVFLNENGGAVALISAARVSYGSQNQSMLRGFYEHLFDMEGGDYLCMGDLYVYAKQIGDNNSKAYAFIGDPALRLNYPLNKVELTSVNGHDVNVADTLRALQRVNVKGVVKDIYDVKMSDFNGTLDISLYDKENTYTTFADEASSPMSFNLRDNVIFSGKVPVVDGEFSADIVLPKDINYSYGKGLMSFYAYNGETDAQGSFTNFIVGGMNLYAEEDTESPEIQLFIDDEKFVDGSMTNENPLLIAYIRDNNGINTSSAGIGHDITVMLTGATDKTYSLNQFYEAPLNEDDFGKLSYKLYNLNDGEHCLTLRVWDIYNNSNTATISFNVVRGKIIDIQNVVNYPNPMYDNTNFTFEHNQKDNEIDIQIKIYDVMGQLVRTISESSYGTTARISPINWDGTSDDGNKLPAGIYIYNVSVTNSQNEKSSGYSKLVIR